MTPAIRFLPKVGEIYRMKISVGDKLRPKNPGDTSRNKFFVVVGTEEDSVSVVSVYINSEINVNKAAKIKDYQLKIWRDDYDFLIKEYSYIDCSRLTVLDTRTMANNATFVGEILPDDLAKIKEYVTAFPTQSRQLMKKYGIIAGDKK